MLESGKWKVESGKGCLYVYMFREFREFREFRGFREFRVLNR